MDTIVKRMSELALTVRCERCDAESKQKIGLILSTRKFQCPFCASLNAVDTSALEAKIGSAQKRREQQRGSGNANAA